MYLHFGFSIGKDSTTAVCTDRESLRIATGSGSQECWPKEFSSVFLRMRMCWSVSGVSFKWTYHNNFSVFLSLISCVACFFFCIPTFLRAANVVVSRNLFLLYFSFHQLWLLLQLPRDTQSKTLSILFMAEMAMLFLYYVHLFVLNLYGNFDFFYVISFFSAPFQDCYYAILWSKHKKCFKPHTQS